jgi:hypothetical protein
MRESGSLGSLESEALCQGFDSYVFLERLPRLPNFLPGRIGPGLGSVWHSSIRSWLALNVLRALVKRERVGPYSNQSRNCAMNKPTIIAELENMVVARLFSGQRWPADRETCAAIIRKLIQLGLWERISVEPCTWQITPLGKELDVDLFNVFLGIIEEWEVPIILERYGLIDESEIDALYSMETAEADASAVLSGYLKRAYFEYRKATKFLH